MGERAVPFEVAESALAHSKARVVAEYQRSDLAERRRPWMQMWADILDGKAPAGAEAAGAEIIPLIPLVRRTAA